MVRVKQVVSEIKGQKIFSIKNKETDIRKLKKNSKKPSSAQNNIDKIQVKDFNTEHNISWLGY